MSTKKEAIPDTILTALRKLNSTFIGSTIDRSKLSYQQEIHPQFPSIQTNHQGNN